METKRDINRDLVVLGLMTNVLCGGGNRDSLFPQNDVADLAAGASYIPEEVTDARRNGKRVVYFTKYHSWQMDDGRIVR